MKTKSKIAALMLAAALVTSLTPAGAADRETEASFMVARAVLYAENCNPSGKTIYAEKIGPLVTEFNRTYGTTRLWATKVTVRKDIKLPDFCDEYRDAIEALVIKTDAMLYALKYPEAYEAARSK